MLLKQSPSTPKDVRKSLYIAVSWRFDQPNCRAHTDLGAAQGRGRGWTPLRRQEVEAQEEVATASASSAGDVLGFFCFPREHLAPSHSCRPLGHTFPPHPSTGSSSPPPLPTVNHCRGTYPKLFQHGQTCNIITIFFPLSWLDAWTGFPEKPKHTQGLGNRGESCKSGLTYHRHANYIFKASVNISLTEGTRNKFKMSTRGS